MNNRIQSLREALGLTQEEVARRVGVTRQTINAIENNKYNPTLELAFKLARLFTTTVDNVFLYEGDLDEFLGFHGLRERPCRGDRSGCDQNHDCTPQGRLRRD